MRRYESYKDSGVEWLGKIPSQWELTIGMNVFRENKRDNKGMKEKTVLSLSYGQIIIKPEEKLVGLVPESFETYQIVEPNDIIIRCTDLQNDQTSLRTGLAKDKGIITSAYLNLKVINNHSAKFLHYYLHTLDITKVLYKFGSGLRQNLSFLDFKRLPIIDIPLSEQQKIAQFLDDKTAKIDQAVDLAEKQIALLKEHKQILIQNAVTRGLNPDVPLKDSGVEWIGQVPEHWSVKKIKHVTSKIGSGITPLGGGSNYIDGGIPLLRSQNIHFDRIDLNDVARISEFTHNSMKNSKVRKGDVLLNITGGSLGRCFYVDSNEEMNVNQHVCIIRPNKKINTIFLNMLLASEVGQKQIWFFQQGGGREGLNFQAIKNFYLPLPDLKEQQKIAIYLDKQVAKIDQAIALKTAHIEKLKEYKSVLINDVVTGKVRV
ncbi:restriction endonuclease subunit S [Neisseria flavescens]|uniref:Type I restriction modification DNA specificity domain protein n=1 Tax=Neisseria flavescens NRL30031/H210 TaxID=546264 RepID=C0EPF1_NEIFL|nr:restriction endonuclease subunit S [Neisseria flavescens]SPY01570.1 Type I restriction enzyme EcoKI specificity protein [Neisseria meningitidis]EEG33097.1 type I restriction modification DNA specificity domain protein [Neisseria flavescens NRL30031/H210]QCL69590.1 restriction endonuclease subunit S [Neisseria flavescens]SPY11440.1 Type I restriction enzyme EcoKI specificity protein [Neisseria meningitidis]STZ66154.1 Type I restriction enzyme EcoKI specificity protein [Neisseria flavescens]